MACVREPEPSTDTRPPSIKHHDFAGHTPGAHEIIFHPADPLEALTPHGRLFCHLGGGANHLGAGNSAGTRNKFSGLRFQISTAE